MPTAYLHKVLIYLQQELPENYREQLSLTGEKLVITIPDTADFSQVYGTLHPIIVSSVARIRSRDNDLEFTIRSTRQERDFKLLK